MENNIILIGMPGTGKTTVGKVISQKTGLKYIDTDDLIKAACGMELKHFVATNGTEAFLSLQRKVICDMKIMHSIIATGGGVVEDSKAMEYLRTIGKIFYLSTSVEVLEARLTPDRKLVRRDGESFRDIFNKRQPLYEKFSDFTINCEGKDVSRVADEICTIIEARSMDK